MSDEPLGAIEPESSDIPDNLVEVARIHAVTARIRIIAICVVVSIGLICVTVALIKVFAKPGWVQVTLAIIAALLGPSGVIWFLLRSRRKFVEKHHRRIVVLEGQLDKERSSSAGGSASISEQREGSEE